MVAGYLGLPLHGRYSHSRPDPLATARCLEGRQPTRLGALSLEKHPDKTFIGRIERGFDFLGYHFSPAGPSVAKTAITNFIEKASRLYEQERSAVSAGTALEMYVRRWLRWFWSGMIKSNLVSLLITTGENNHLQRRGRRGCAS
jgi:hypothetical protein